MVGLDGGEGVFQSVNVFGYVCLCVVFDVVEYCLVLDVFGIG